MDEKIPSYNEYQEKKQFFDRLAEKILDYQKEEKYNVILDKISTEKKELKKMSKEQFEDRYAKGCWIQEFDDNDGYNVNCYYFNHTGDCWWSGNRDRMKEYSYYYRFPGQDEITLCHVCYENGHYLDDEIWNMTRDFFVETLLEESDSEDDQNNEKNSKEEQEEELHVSKKSKL